MKSTTTNKASQNVGIRAHTFAHQVRQMVSAALTKAGKLSAYCQDTDH